MSKTVFVGLSGGVDSATSAALLLEQGYNVVGAFIKIWQPEFIECTWAKDRLDAMRVAATLGIPFEEVDLSEEYKSNVVNQMVHSYTSGKTPNPDVACNTLIKFGSFATWAKRRGADAVATGHYARVRKSELSYELLRGKDSQKDQSYFLHQLSSEQLSGILFPIGSMLKSEVRTRANSMGLPVAKKNDSQGLCFVGDVSMRDFLKRYMTVVKGDVRDGGGNIIGHHEGAALYTVGQRHGFTILSEGDSLAHYITYIDVKRNILVVSPNKVDAQTQKISARDVHWVAGTPPLASEIYAQFRYRESPVLVQLETVGDELTLLLNEPRVAAAGQSVVFYNEEMCLGGAIISRT